MSASPAAYPGRAPFTVDPPAENTGEIAPSPLPYGHGPGGPRSASSAYGAVIRHTQDPREIEAEVLSRVTARLLEARPHELPTVIHDNRMVWLRFAADLAHPENKLPDQLKAHILSLSMWVFAESDRVIRQGKSVQALVDVNRSIIAGLRPTAESTPEEGS